MPPRLAFIGAGAIGGYVGGHLARLGHDVTLIDPWPAHVEAIRARGLEIAGLTAAECVRVAVPALHLTEVQAIAKQRPIDIAFVAVKSYDTAWATAIIAPYLAPSGFVVSLQNCINEATIAGVVGWGRTVGMIAATLSAELYEPGRIRRTVPLANNPAVFAVGEVHGRATARVQAIVDMIAAIDTVKLTKNLWGERWSKLCVNAMRNGISAATGLSGRDCDADPRLRRLAIRLGGEAVRIGQALGYRLVPIQTVAPDLLARAAAGDAAALAQAEATLLEAAATAGRSPLQRPSMAQDMLKGRRTEIGQINGFVVAEGAGAGLAAPANAALADIVGRVERGEVAARRETIAGINA